MSEMTKEKPPGGIPEVSTWRFEDDRCLKSLNDRCTTNFD